ASGLADQPQRLAAADIEADAVDRMNALGIARQQPAFQRKMLHQVLHPQQRLTGGLVGAGDAHNTQATSWSVAIRRSGGVAAVQTGIAIMRPCWLPPANWCG